MGMEMATPLKRGRVVKEVERRRTARYTKEQKSSWRLSTRARRRTKRQQLEIMTKVRTKAKPRRKCWKKEETKTKGKRLETVNPNASR
jgi:hypothetical protein